MKFPIPPSAVPFKSRHKPSYKSANCCGIDCFFYGIAEGQDCWGLVELDDDEVETGKMLDLAHTSLSHLCRGHRDAMSGDNYCPYHEEAQ